VGPVTGSAQWEAQPGKELRVLSPGSAGEPAGMNRRKQLCFLKA